jgi:hypothetical protein
MNKIIDFLGIIYCPALFKKFHLRPTDWAFHLRTGAESSVRNVVLSKKVSMVNVEKLNICTKCIR